MIFKNIKRPQNMSRPPPPDEPTSDAYPGSLICAIEEFEIAQLTDLKRTLWKDITSTALFKALPTERAQVKYCVENLCNNQPKELRFTHEQLASVFGITRQSLEELYKKETTERKLPHRPSLLNESQHVQLKSFMISTFQTQNFIFLEEIQSFIESKFGLQLKPDSLRHMIKGKYKDIGKYSIAKPIEDTRFLVNQNDLIQYYNKLAGILHLIDYRYCFNIDETGEQEYVDARKFKVLVPSEYPLKETFVPIKRGSKRYTIVHCITSGGEYFPLCYIIPRKTFPNDIYRFTNPEAIMIQSQEKGFMTDHLFENYFNNHFIKHLNAMRRRDEYHGPALLIMDNLLSHKKAVKARPDENYVFIAEYNLHVLFLVPHSSDQSQPLDLGIFSVHKSIMQRLKKPTFLSPFASQIYVASQSLEQASNSCAIINSFKAAGIIRKVVNANPLKLGLAIDFTACSKLRNPLPNVEPYKWPLKNVKI